MRLVSKSQTIRSSLLILKVSIIHVTHAVVTCLKDYVKKITRDWIADFVVNQINTDRIQFTLTHSQDKVT
jgi:hypothetical protein